MPLIIRQSPTEGVLRSVDDHPGIVGLADDEDRHLRWVVYTKWHVSPDMRKTGDQLLAAGRGGVLMDIHAEDPDDPDPAPERERVYLDTAEFIAACDTLETVRNLQPLWTAAVQNQVQLIIANGVFELMGTMMESCIEFRDAYIAELRKRGAIPDPPEGQA